MQDRLPEPPENPSTHYGSGSLLILFCLTCTFATFVAALLEQTSHVSSISSISLGSMRITTFVSRSSLSSQASGYSNSSQPPELLYRCNQCTTSIAVKFCQKCKEHLCNVCCTSHDQNKGCALINVGITYNAESKGECAPSPERSQAHESMPASNSSLPDMVPVLTSIRESESHDLQQLIDSVNGIRSNDNIVKEAFRQMKISKQEVEAAEKVLRETAEASSSTISKIYAQGDVWKQEAFSQLDEEVNYLCSKAWETVGPVLAACRKQSQDHRAHAVSIVYTLKRVRELETRESGGEDIAAKMEEEKKCLREKMSCPTTSPDLGPPQLNFQPTGQSELRFQPCALIGQFQVEEQASYTKLVDFFKDLERNGPLYNRSS